MLSPQEVQEKTFSKAVFGGYDMATVDDFLDAVSTDYAALYSENTVLKNRMKVLIEKLEEYRAQEDAMKKALIAAQQSADELTAATEQKCAQALQDAQSAADEQVRRMREDINLEEDRVTEAHRLADEYITKLRAELEHSLDALDALKIAADDRPTDLRPRAYDFESEADDPAGLARKIEESMQKLVGEGESVPESAPQEEGDTKKLPSLDRMDRLTESARLKYNLDELQFGEKYTQQ